MKNFTDGLGSRWDTADKGIRNLEDILIESQKTEKQRKKIVKEHYIQGLWGKYKRCNIHVMGIPG